MNTDNIIAPAPVSPMPDQPRQRPPRKIKRKKEASYLAQNKRRRDEGSDETGGNSDQVDRYV